MTQPTLDGHWFYGPSRTKKSKCEGGRNERVVQWRGGLSDGGDIRHVFNRQRDAYQYLHDQRDHRLRIFSFEDDDKRPGRRRFMVCTADRFWHDYQLWNQRHFYELVMETRPCRLYFDLEFYREFNEELFAAADQCMSQFVSAVCHLLNVQYSLHVDQNDFVDLDASTGEKFSRHLIGHLPENALFRDNQTMGVFVERLCVYLEECDIAMVSTGDGRKVPLCDKAVYTRNRNFRLFLSTKAGQENPLKLAPSCQFYSKRVENDEKPNEKRIFMDALVLDINSEGLLLSGGNEQTVKTEDGKENDASDSKILEGSVDRQKSLDRQKPVLQGDGGPSPFPHIDAHILATLHPQSDERARKGYVRKWRLLGEEERWRLVYEIGGCRYCHRVEREHRSNHVYWLVELDRRVAYQKCHDWQCKDFRSNDFPLPVSLSTHISPQLLSQGQGHIPEDTDQLSQSDIDLCRAVEQWEKENGYA